MRPFVRDDGLRRVAYDLLRQARERWFGRPRRDPQLVAEASAERISATLARASYTPNWVLSYHYHGEDVNLARFFYDPERYPTLPYRQDHVRLFVDEHDGVGLMVHTEPNALVHRDAHLDGRTAAITPAVERVRGTLADADVHVREAQR